MVMAIVRRIVQVTGLDHKIDAKLGRTVTRTIGCKVDMQTGRDFISCCFVFVRKDPYAVKLAFLDGNFLIQEWGMARDLIKIGLERSVGEGDVTIAPGYDEAGHEVIIMTLSCGGTTATFTFMRDRYKKVVDLIFECVPEGHESRYQVVPGADRFLS